MVENSPSSPGPNPSSEPEKSFALYDLTVEPPSEEDERRAVHLQAESLEPTIVTSVNSPEVQSTRPVSPEGEDLRVYVPDPEGWEARIKQDSEKIYCYQKNPSENYFHLIVSGEIYLQRGTEKLCLRCAHRRGVLSRDRLHWQHRVKRVTTPWS